jgi:hypothetical protein
VASLPVKRAFILALSHREKARGLVAEAEQAAAAGALDPERHAALRDFYAKHLGDAEARLARLQDRERRKLGSLEHQLRATINDQARLVDRAVAGKVTPEKANALNRQYQQEIAGLESAIEATESLLNATHSQDLGGFVDLPLEEYIFAQQHAFTPVERWRARRWAIFFAAVFVTLLLVFLILRQGPTGRNVDAVFTQTEPDIITITVTNTGSQSAELLVPVPEGGADGFGLQVLVREQGRDTFSLLPASDECWKNNGLPILGAPLTLIPNIPVQVTLDLSRLQLLVNQPDAAEVALVSPRGATIAKDEFPVQQPAP